MIKKINYIFIVLNIFVLNLAADNSGAATNIFLRADLTPRASAMGGAFSAVTGGVPAAIYNPAGLTDINSFDVSLNHTSWLRDIYFENILLGYKVDNKLALAFGFSYLGMPEIQGKDENGDKTQMLNVSSSVAFLGIGYKIYRGISAGINVKYFYDNIADYNSSGTAIDFGFLYSGLTSGLNLGFSLQNISGDVQYESRKESLPFLYRTGISYEIRQINSLLALDLVKAVDTGYQLHIGAEYKILDMFSIRIGDRIKADGALNWSAGFGVKYKKQFILDYALETNSALGYVHRFGFTYRLPKKSIDVKKYLNAKVTDPVSLTAPKNLNYKIEDGSLIIKWDKIAGVQYNVYARTESQKEYKKINKHPLYSNQTKFKKPNSNEKKIYIVVTSVLNEKESSFSKELKIDVQ